MEEELVFIGSVSVLRSGLCIGLLFLKRLLKN